MPAPKQVTATTARRAARTNSKKGLRRSAPAQPLQYTSSDPPIPDHLCAQHMSTGTPYPQDLAADGADDADTRAHTHGDFEPNPPDQHPKTHRQRHSMRQDTQQQQQQQQHSQQDSQPGSPSTTRQKFRESASRIPRYASPNNSPSSTESAKSRTGANCQRLEVDENLVRFFVSFPSGLNSASE